MPSKTFFSSILLVGFVVISSACGGGSGGSNSATLRIGVLNTGTGDLESFGPSVSAAVDLAEREINQKLESEGAGFAVEMQIEDTGGDPAVALQKLQLFAAAGIRTVIGPMSSAEAEAVRDFSSAQGIVLISPSSTAVSLERSDDLLVRLAVSDRGQASAMTAALRHFRHSFYAPIWRADTFGDDITKIVGESFSRRGGGFAPGARYPLTTTDYSRPLSQLEIQLKAYTETFGRNSSSVYAVAFDEIVQLLAQASLSQSLKEVHWFGSDGIALDYLIFTNPAATQFMIDTRFLSPIFSGDSSSPEFIRIRSEIAREVGHNVRPYAVLVYDAVTLAVRAHQALGDREVGGTALRDEIIRISQGTVGASGALSLDASGDRASGNYEFWKVVRDADGNPEWAPGGRYVAETRVFTPQ